MSWSIIVEYFEGMARVSLNILEVAVPICAITWAMFKFFGKKTIDYFYAIKLESYKKKLEAELELKKSKYALLTPKQNEIVTNLHSKFIRLKRVADIRIRYNAFMEKSINNCDNEEPKADEEIVIKTEFIPIYPNSNDTRKADFNAEEISEMMALDELNKEILQYIEDNRIYLPEQLYKLVYAFCPIINVLLVLNTPNIAIRAGLQKQGYSPLESTDMAGFVTDFVSTTNLDTENIEAFIELYASLMDDEFRKLIGVS